LSASGTGNAVTLTGERDLVAPVTVTFGSGNTGAGATLRDSGVYPLPPEPFIQKPAMAGQIRIYTRSSGRGLDPDGYVVTLDSQPAQTVGANDSMSFENAPIGRHLVRLTGLAQYCLPTDTLAAVTVLGEGLWPVTIDVQCMGPIREDVEIAFVRDAVPDGQTVNGCCAHQNAREVQPR
jgi:hypothetical protein